MQEGKLFLDEFLETARRQPNAIAVLQPSGPRLTYRELLHAVIVAARRLERVGVTPGALVALALPRSEMFVTSALSCWWIGAAFLPLDLDQPLSRREAILAEAGPAVICSLDETGHLTIAGEVPNASNAIEAVVDPFAFSPYPLQPDTLAYVIFTSGSTGKPKGVAVEHRGLPFVLMDQVAAFDLRPGDRSLWILSPAFDASLSDIGTTLLAGATLVIGPQGATNPTLLNSLLQGENITHIDLPPALLPCFDASALPPRLRTIIIGGEPAAPALVRQLAQRVRVVNVYGPTEATICTSLCVCDPHTWEEPLLGQEISGIRYHILDAQLAPVPAGVEGELCIEGTGLAREYLNQPELTARKFVSYLGIRIYRTGDRVRQRADGEYVFLGRMDRQIKQHGRLIAPEEIETVVLRLPDVRQAAVLLRHLDPGEAGPEILVAFVVTNSPALSPREVREWGSQHLPPWMVPQLVVVLPQLPRTASGKIDMDLLRRHPLTHRQQGKSDSVAFTVMDCCRQVLGVESIDPNQSFFDQGGASLTLLQVVSTAATRGLPISPALLADGLALADVAAHLQMEAALSRGAMEADRLRQDVTTILAAPLVAPAGAGSRPGSARCIFLTGATGFLGSYLLAELLRRSQAEIICLVRAGSIEEGRQRLQHADRVEVVTGDLALPRLGLTQTAWDALANRVDTIVHAAALVHLVAPYEELRGPNVLGTAAVVQLATQGRTKHLHHLSTLSVFVATDRNTGVVLESDDLRETQVVYGGYAQSKWAAEWLVRQAASSVDRVVIHRLGLITGDSRTGRVAPHDFLTLFARGLVQLGRYPSVDGTTLRLDVTPVDFASAALAHLILNPGSEPSLQTFHLAGAGSLSLADLVAGLAARGVFLTQVPVEQWQALPPSRGGWPAAAAYLALCRAQPDDVFTAYRTMDLFQATGVCFDMRNTQGALHDSGITCPLPDEAILERYLGQALGEEPTS